MGCPGHRARPCLYVGLDRLLALGSRARIARRLFITRYRRMIVSGTKIAGVYTIDLERRRDNRGYFSRMFCSDEFSRHGLRPIVAQANLSFNARRGTLRGLHFQYPPATETKYVRCARGAILDIAVDLRPESRPTSITSPFICRRRMDEGFIYPNVSPTVSSRSKTTRKSST